MIISKIIKKKKKKSFIGIVSSNKNNKTITVLVENSKKHPIYHKNFKFTKKYHVHDEKNQAKIGDKVEFIVTRPLSALKRFRLLQIIKVQNKNNINELNKG